MQGWFRTNNTSLGRSIGTLHSRSTSSLSIAEDHGPSPEPPPPITFEQLHNEARAVASRVLNRPQSGGNFVEDAREALVMWADRLSTLLDPPRKGRQVILTFLTTWT